MFMQLDSIALHLHHLDLHLLLSFFLLVLFLLSLTLERCCCSLDGISVIGTWHPPDSRPVTSTAVTDSEYVISPYSKRRAASIIIGQ